MYDIFMSVRLAHRYILLYDIIYYNNNIILTHKTGQTKRVFFGKAQRPMMVVQWSFRSFFSFFSDDTDGNWNTMATGLRLARVFRSL